MGLVTSVNNLELKRSNSSLNAAKGDSVRSDFREALQKASYGQTESMDDIFSEAASRYGLPVSLIKAVAKTESDFNTKAVSHAGAIGVMQLMPGTARALGVNDPFDARENIMGGAKYLRENLDRFNGNIDYALAAYNAGPSSVEKYGGIPPYKETQNYVKKVNSYLEGTDLYANKNVPTGTDFFNAGGNGLYSNMLTGLLSTVSYEETGEGGEGKITMDKESFANLIQVMRIQMMMNVSRDVGTITL